MTVSHPRPRAQPLGRILSNGTLASLVTERGTGFIVDGELALTRWTGDPLEDPGGFAWTVRNRESGAAFGFGPRLPNDGASPVRAESSAGILTLEREWDDLSLRMTVGVPPGFPGELRRLDVTHQGERHCAIDLTGCAEVVLASADADAAHPVFSKLFVQTEWREASRALLARRRPREANAPIPWLLHALDGPGLAEFETDRARFTGRAGGMPAALRSNAALSRTTGNVLDPVLAFRRVITLAPGETRTWHSVLARGSDPEALVAELEAWRAGDPDAGFAAAAEEERRRRRAAGLSDAEAEAAHDLLTAIAYRLPVLRGPARAFADTPASLDGSALAGLSPDGWLVVADADAAGGPERARLLAGITRFARSLGLPVELLVVARDAGAWGRAAESGPGVLARSPAELGDEALAHLAVIARAWIAGELPRLDWPGGPAVEVTGRPPAGGPSPTATITAAPAPDAPETLERFNGIGGFAGGGREYVIRLRRDAAGRLALPPQPWTNVIANPDFGCLVSESGAGFTWSGNSREHRLTPWFNDPVLDPHGEALYVRDDERDEFWSPQPGPAPAPADYEVRHRAGATTWQLDANGLSHRTTVGVTREARVRIARVAITNRGPALRRLRVVSYQRLVLGTTAGSPWPMTRCDPGLNAVLARNPLDPDYAASLAWAATVAPDGATARVGDDRAAFLGARGTPARPRSLESGDPPAAAARGDLDPVAILEVSLEIPPGETRWCAFLLGEEPDADAVPARLAGLRAPGAIDAALDAATAGWDALHDRLHITTPEPALDLVLNHWLPCQNLSCRIWGRSALYQSGGAFGFRDQLQDASALVWLRPDLTRRQILLHAAHQFVEGDVLHWWHPPRSRGIRTRFADDLLWLPLLTAHYVSVTGDAPVLDEIERFLTAPALAEGEAEAYLEPADSGERGSVYEHAARAIDRSLATGERGLPLFGCGDWNDGMNRVGADGRGESVWMAFFLHATITAFAPFADERGEHDRVHRWREHQRRLERALERAGWDGEWYRRGYYDDGTPLGSATSDECRIDALVQAWSVISGAVPRERAEAGMRSLERRLVSRPERLVRLLAPPFEHTPHDPGYIKGYVAGVRENGGQYTHAAMWVVRAMAELGWRDRAAATLAMTSPVSQTGDPESVARYRIEPYVVAADIYGAPPHVGRGGWSWYTGSAGWMYRVTIESIFGLEVEGGARLALRPCLPDEWPEATLEWTVPATGTRLRIHYRNPSGRADSPKEATLDGTRLEIRDGRVLAPLPGDGGRHEIVVVLG